MKEPGRSQKIRWKLSVTDVTASHTRTIAHFPPRIPAMSISSTFGRERPGSRETLTVFKNEKPQTPADDWGPRETVIQHCDENTVQPRVFSPTKALGVPPGQTKCCLISRTYVISAGLRVSLSETELNTDVWRRNAIRTLMRTRPVATQTLQKK